MASTSTRFEHLVHALVMRILCTCKRLDYGVTTVMYDRMHI